jgi:hypothetical protein
MERTLLFNFPASLRDVRNWQHLGDVAILANVHFAADSVEKLENRGASKIPQMSDVGEFSYCKAL